MGSLLFLSATILAGGPAGAQGVGSLMWSSGPDLPSPRTEAAAVLASDDAVLLLGGSSPAGETVVPKLANGAAAWTTAPDLDISRITPGATRFGTQGILVYGGLHGGEATDEALLYDYYLADSQDAEKLSVPRQHFAFASDNSGRAYAIGGVEEPGQRLSSAERYLPNSDTWEDIASLPVALSGACAVGVGATHIYVLGGQTAAGIRDTVYRYTIASDSWSSITPLLTPVRDSAAVLSQDRIYVLGGVSPTGPVDTVQVYDLTTGLWSTDALPAARRGHAAVVTASGTILVAGGFDAAGLPSASVFQTQQLNLPETAPVFNTAPVTNGSLDRPYSYDAGAVGNPPPTYSLVTAPAGMGIDAASGLISWQPGPGQVGSQAVTVRATNRVNATDQTFNIAVVNDTFPPTAPTAVQVVEVGPNHVELSWSGATDAVGVDHYGVYRQYRCGWRGSKRCYSLVQGDIPGTTTTITGLTPLTSYTYAVRAFDADGNVSPNSPLVSFKTLSPPVFLRYAGATTLPANFPLQLQFYVNANPAATFAILSGPSALTLDPETGLASWIPTPTDVGIHTLVVRATNSGGSIDLSVDLTVNPDAPQLSAQITSGSALAGSPWAAQIFDGSHTTSTFALLSSPPGMTLDPATGQLSWVPTPDDAGTCSVMVRATNAAATADITFEFYCYFTGAISNPQVTGLTDLYPTAIWSAPVGPGADRTAGYTIIATARYRYGRSYRSHRVAYETDAETLTVSLPGLVSGRTYTLYVNPFDEFDNCGLTNSPGLPFVPRPGLPSVGWTVADDNGGAGLVAGQELVVNFTEYGTAYGPVSYSPVSVPIGFTLDPVTGEGRWTPGAADVGSVPITVRATNDIGSRDITINILVKFSGPVRNAYTTRDGNAAAYWQPPLDNLVPVASYRVTMHWQWSSRSYSRSMTTTNTSLAFSLIPTGAVWHKGVTITPLDADGRAGVSTPLIPYNGALPAGLPPADPAWIESVTVDPGGTPLLEIRGVVGVVADLEVTNDFSLWDPIDTVTIGEDGVVVCPDPTSQSAPQSYYRLRVP
ncbi:MAG: putative Ig domain-containing protein [Verrucomicrobia bacterium]|nr:putative Ig domain-containing protein [Verrucomicrobiota bacterium]